MKTVLRAVSYVWASPTTAIGLVIVGLTLLTGGRARFVSGVIEAHGGFARWWLERLVPLPGGASAMTIGHIVVGRNAATLAGTRSHERVHVRQCERWGPLFIPAYFAASGWQWVRGGDPYRDNPFERQAYEEE